MINLIIAVTLCSVGFLHAIDGAANLSDALTVLQDAAKTGDMKQVTALLKNRSRKNVEFDLANFYTWYTAKPSDAPSGTSVMKIIVQETKSIGVTVPEGVARLITDTPSISGMLGLLRLRLLSLVHTQHKKSTVPKLSLTLTTKPALQPLVNQNNSCFVDSVLQAMAYVPEFREKIKGLATQGDAKQKYVCSELDKLFVSMQKHGYTPLQPKDFLQNVIQGILNLNVGGAAGDSFLAYTALERVIWPTGSDETYTGLSDFDKIDQAIAPGSGWERYYKNVFLMMGKRMDTGDRINPKSICLPPSKTYEHTYKIGPNTYELVAVVASSGAHATCYAHHPGDPNWYFYDDMDPVVKKISAREITQQLLSVPLPGESRLYRPALLFYRLVDA